MVELLSLLDRLVRWLAHLAGIVLVGLAIFTVIAALMRYLFNAPIAGAIDISQMTLVVVVFCAVAYCGRAGGHVGVDIFVDMMPKRTVRWVDVGTKLISAMVFAILAWQCWKAGFDAIELEEATQTIDIPHAPFLWVVTAGSILYGVALLLEAVILAAGRDLPDIDRTA